MGRVRRGVAITLGPLVAVAVAASPAWAAAPDAPTAPSVTAGAAQITVSFTPPADNGSTITGYKATCSGGAGSASQSGPSSPITVSGLTNGASYTCTVDATNGDGTSGESPPSPSVKPASIPDAPSITHATVTNTQVALTFTAGNDNGSPITSFTATCSGGLMPVSATGASSPITVAGLARGTTYTCVVTATNANGTGPDSSSSLVVIPAQAPSAPARPALASGDGKLTATFNTPASNGSPITSYVVVCTGGFVPVAVAGPSSPIVVTGLTNGTVYVCTVTANNAIGSGPASPESLPGIPSTVPSAPAQPTVVRGVSKIVVKFSAPANNGAAITSYTVTCSATHGVTRAQTGPSSPITVGGVTNGRSYTCVVAARNVSGLGAASSPSASVIPGAAPAPPAIVSVVSGRAPGPVGPLVVAFKAGSNNGTPISTFRATCTPTAGGTAKVVTSTGTPITVPGLTTGRPYSCSVVAISASGTSGPSASRTTIVGTPGIPRVSGISGHGHGLTILFVVPGNNGNLILHYHAVCRSTNGGATASQFARGSPFGVNGLTPGGRYTCSLTAINGRGEGPSATTSAVRIPFK